MCFKKEYKCYKGKESEDCCKKRVDEAVSHRTTIIVLAISIALMILALTVKTADNSAFVEQVSFASTITSIVLSVIAIWMSITGERSTNEIKDKVSTSVDKLMETTSKSTTLTNDLQMTLDSQNAKYDEIMEKMGNVVKNIEGMKVTVGSMNDILSTIGTSVYESDGDVNKNGFTEEELVKMTNIVLNSFRGPSADEGKKILKKALAFVYDRKSKNEDTGVNILSDYLKKEYAEDKIYQAYINSGIVYVLGIGGLFNKVDKEKLGL